MADALNFAADAPEHQEYSAFGTELHFAAVYPQHLGKMAEEAQAWADSPLRVRQKLSAIRVDGARISAVRVVNVSAPRVVERDGQQLALRPAGGAELSGRNAGLDVTLNLSAREVQAARQAKLQHAAARSALADTDGTRPRKRSASRPDAQDIIKRFCQVNRVAGRRSAGVA